MQAGAIFWIDSFEEFFLFNLPVLLMLSLVFLIWKTLRLMPRTKP